jgi:hypothetical protein
MNDAESVARAKAIIDEVLLESLGLEVALLLGYPFLEPHMRLNNKSTHMFALLQ